MRSLARGLRALGVEVELLYLGNLRRPGEALRAQMDLRRLAAEYDLLHAQFGSACAFLTATAPGPKVVSLRGSDWHRYHGPVRSERRASFLATSLSRLTLGRFDAVITMSDRMAAEVRRNTDHPSVAVIPDPIDLHAFRPLDRQASRHGIEGTDHRAPWILFTTIRTSNPVKRVELAQEAVAVARQRLGKLELRIASGIPHDQMPRFVSACDVALCTSTHEGWPNSIKEALACGIPFVATDVSDLAEIAERHPSCHIADPDPARLADAICNAVMAPYDDSLPDAVASMSIEATSEKLLALYSGVLRELKR